MEFREQKALDDAMAVRITGVDGQITVNPETELTDDVRVTVPVKFWTLVRVTAIDEVAPLLKLTGPEAVIVKSPT